jgi:membrane-associated HD superfamily phosphohydrolase
LVFAALLYYSENKVKNWIVPFVGLATFALIFVTYHILRFNSFGDPMTYIDGLDFNYENYNSLKMIIAITILLSFGLWASLFYIKSIHKKLKTFRPSFIIILIMAIIAVIVVVISPNKDGSEILFLFAPLAIIITNYLEVIEEKWFKEILIGTLILIPISFQFF